MFSVKGSERSGITEKKSQKVGKVRIRKYQSRGV